MLNAMTETGESTLGFVDDPALFVVAQTSDEAHAKLKCMIERPGGRCDWQEECSSP